MRRSESSSVLQRYNSRRKSSISGGRTASASMIGVLTPKSLSSMKDYTRKERSAWSRIFSPLTFGFEREESSCGGRESSYSLSRRRTHDYSKSCPSFQRKESLRPSPNTQVRDRSVSVPEDAGKSAQQPASGVVDLGLEDDVLGLNDLSSSVFEPVLGQMSKSNNISRVQAFSGRDAVGHLQRSKTMGFIREESRNRTTSIYNDLKILRFHDGISGKTYKAKGGTGDEAVRSDSGTGFGIGFGLSAKSNPLCATETSFVEVGSSSDKSLHLNRGHFVANRNTTVSESLSNTKFVQGDVPYCDSILYLDDPKSSQHSTSFSILHDNSFYRESFNSRFE